MQELGLVGAEGEIALALKGLLDALAAPVAVVRIEVTGEQGPVQHGLVVGPDSVIAHDGWPGEEESEYLSLLPSTLVWEIARMVGLRGGAASQAPAVSRIETTMGALDAALAALGALGGAGGAGAGAGGGPGASGAPAVSAAPAAPGSPAAPGGPNPVLPADGVPLARAALAAADPSLDDPGLGVLADLVCALGSSWRVTVVWGAPPTPAAEPVTALRALAVWDCGPLGYWIRELPEEPILPGQVTPETVLCLIPTTTSAIWERLTDLLPDAEEVEEPQPVP